MKQHRESDLQIRCLKWFRYQYPAYARLLEHPHNEGNAFNRRQQTIANAEGVTKGVADLILHVPSFYKIDASSSLVIYHSLAVEMKDANGRQSPDQKIWQRLFEAAGGVYLIVRDYDFFVQEITKWMLNVPMYIDKAVKQAHSDIEAEEHAEAVKQFKQLINKN